MSPLVSIILPVYNCEKYIRKTIDSVLNQTYSNFELLVIDDGSTDATSIIVQSFIDNRIQLIQFKKNKGLIEVLNHGIKIAKGKYIARLDGDDICLPTRLEKQVNWLEKKQKTAVVATQISFINEDDETTGDWQLDIQTNTADQIRKAMLWECCIAHPSVMMRAEIIKQYQYSIRQKHTEDYDLWLQILSDGFCIEKIPEQLLQYRVHTQSVTGSFHRKKNPFFTVANTKRKFLINQIKKISFKSFELAIVGTMIHDVLMGIGKEIKKLFKI
jgi:glycosyltransferase involved in cell wall biosynthesis